MNGKQMKPRTVRLQVLLGIEKRREHSTSFFLFCYIGRDEERPLGAKLKHTLPYALSKIKKFGGEE